MVLLTRHIGIFVRRNEKPSFRILCFKISHPVTRTCSKCSLTSRPNTSRQSNAQWHPIVCSKKYYIILAISKTVFTPLPLMKLSANTTRTKTTNTMIADAAKSVFATASKGTEAVVRLAQDLRNPLAMHRTNEVEQRATTIQPTNAPRYIFGSLTRISDLEKCPFDVCKIMDKDRWETGDYLVGRYISPGHRHAYATPASEGHFCELPTGRHRYYHPGDITVGALGNRNATKEICGDWKEIRHPDPDGGPTILDDIDGAGLFGKVTSLSSRVSPHAQFEYLGHVFRQGKKVVMQDFCPSDDKIPPTQVPPQCPTVLVLGTSMSCGKSCAARVVIGILREMGVSNVVAAKMTGAGYYNDILSFADAGASSVIDFVDAGLPSTVVPEKEYRSTLYKLFGMVNERNPDVLVVEAGASPCESYNGQVVVEAFANHKNLFIILAASDAYSVTGAKQELLETVGIRPDMVAGIIANTSAGRDLVVQMTDLPASSLNTDEAVEELAQLLAQKLNLQKLLSVSPESLMPTNTKIQ